MIYINEFVSPLLSLEQDILSRTLAAVDAAKVLDGSSLLKWIFPNGEV